MVMMTIMTMMMMRIAMVTMTSTMKKMTAIDGMMMHDDDEYDDGGDG